jgi:hypothetical protein
MKDNFVEGGKDSSKRRSQRLLLQVSVTIRREGKSNAFVEETNTLVVNAHGALVALSKPVQSGETLIIVHKATKEERPCRVAYLGPSADGKGQVGIEFIEPAPNYWHISFPPEDWATSPASRLPKQ